MFSDYVNYLQRIDTVLRRNIAGYSKDLVFERGHLTEVVNILENSLYFNHIVVDIEGTSKVSSILSFDDIGLNQFLRRKIRKQYEDEWARQKEALLLQPKNAGVVSKPEEVRVLSQRFHEMLDLARSGGGSEEKQGVVEQETEVEFENPDIYEESEVVDEITIDSAGIDEEYFGEGDDYSEDDFDELGESGDYPTLDEDYPEETYLEEDYPEEDYLEDDYSEEDYPEEDYSDEDYLEEDYPEDENYSEENYPEEDYSDEDYLEEDYPEDENYSEEDFNGLEESEGYPTLDDEYSVEDEYDDYEEDYPEEDDEYPKLDEDYPEEDEYDEDYLEEDEYDEDYPEEDDDYSNLAEEYTEENEDYSDYLEEDISGDYSEGEYPDVSEDYPEDEYSDVSEDYPEDEYSDVSNDYSDDEEYSDVSNDYPEEDEYPDLSEDYPEEDEYGSIDEAEVGVAEDYPEDEYSDEYVDEYDEDYGDGIEDYLFDEEDSNLNISDEGILGEKQEKLTNRGKYDDAKVFTDAAAITRAVNRGLEAVGSFVIRKVVKK